MHLPPRSRTRFTAALTLALAACLGGSIAPDNALTSSLAPVQPAAAAPRFQPDNSRLTASAQTSAPSGALPAADTGTLTQLPGGQDCPSGTTRSTTHYRNGFEDGKVPEPTYSQHWSPVTGGAHGGSYALRSVISSADAATQPPDPGYWRLGLPMLTVPGGRTILRYSIKGTYPAQAAFVSVNNASGWADPSPTWGTVTLDVTTAIQPADNNVADIRFANFPETPDTDSTIDLDDVEVYTCAPASGVRGDYNGDGIADMLTINSAGTLQLWPGNGGFRLRAPSVAGVGWQDATWLGSSGDLNGDGRADILARFSNGDLRVYYGDGVGGFTGGVQKVGTGWNIINAIVPMGDINGDGLPDFLARDTSGQMRRYWLAGVGGQLTGGVVVGTGFGIFTSLLSMGDFDHDGRFDLTGILGNGDMKVYTTLPTGALWGTGQKIGWSWFFRQVISGGDYNKDGLPDVLAFDNAGNIYSYPVLGDGRWGARVLTGSDFGGFKFIA